MTTKSVSKYSCCNPVFWKHDDGWDVYPRSECHQLESGEWIPSWFDCAFFQDVDTKKEAQRLVAASHVFGFCLLEWKEG